MGEKTAGIVGVRKKTPLDKKKLEVEASTSARDLKKRSWSIKG